MNHYAIDGPTVISFSGGRTSAYMLHQTLEANNGLPSDAIVCFQNTGKEAPQTLDFVQECGQRWGVEIVWLEFAGFEPPGRSHCLFDIVTRETCKTHGEPFELLCEQLGILPNPVARTCTANLKIKTMIAYLKSIGWDEWDIFLGIRADEPSRAARMMKPGRDNRGGDPVLPLWRAGVGSRDVAAFWAAQPFDLRLSNHNGKTMHGNCDLCFLKPPKQLLSLIREDPSRAVWWAKMEEKHKATFYKDRPGYAAMAHFNAVQDGMFDGDIEESADCFCGD
jgi:3'-phosphoadenosine 5'-phosphosulfate sulfotransferase (PAPS reductase)/FAD synthetase